jgi:hypothetical protein
MGKPKPPGVKWTSARDGFLMKLVAAGLNREVIAAKLSARFGQRFTKNAVIGRSNRIKAAAEKKPGVYYRISDAKPRVAAVPKPDSVGNPGGCQYMAGEPNERQFCGKQTVAALRGGPSAWCETHYRAVYQKIDAKKAAAAGHYDGIRPFKRLPANV